MDVRKNYDSIMRTVAVKIAACYSDFRKKVKKESDISKRDKLVDKHGELLKLTIQKLYLYKY